VPVQAQVINLSLLEALVAVDAATWRGSSASSPRNATSMAMADYLAHNHKALKKFLKKVERDLKEVQGINDWDRQVILFLVGINGGDILPGSSRSQRVDEPDPEAGAGEYFPLQVIVQKRRSR